MASKQKAKSVSISALFQGQLLQSLGALTQEVVSLRDKVANLAGAVTRVSQPPPKPPDPYRSYTTSQLNDHLRLRIGFLRAFSRTISLPLVEVTIKGPDLPIRVRL